MNKEYFKPQSIDPRLVRLLNLLKDTPQRDPELVELSRNKFLTELDNLPLPSKQPSPFQRFLIGLGIIPQKNNSKENYQMNKKTRLTVTIVALLVVFVLVLFGGSTATVLASQNSVPGDTFYSIKTRLEQTRLSLSRSPEARVELHLAFAEERIAEIQVLIAEGRYQNIQDATQAFEMHIMNALEELNNLVIDDPDLAASLMDRVSEAIARYASALNEMVDRVPEPLRPNMQDVIDNLGAGTDNTNDSYDDNDNDSYDDDDDNGYDDNDNDSYEDDDDDGYDNNDNDSYDDDDDDSYDDNDNDSYDDDDDDSYDDNDNDSYDDDDDDSYDDDDDDSYDDDDDNSNDD